MIVEAMVALGRHSVFEVPSSAWDSLAMTMRTTENIDTLSIDDLYNNLSVFEQDIQKTSSSSLASDNQKPTANPGLADEVIHSFLDQNNAGGGCDVDLIHEDLDQIDDLEDLERKCKAKSDWKNACGILIRKKLNVSLPQLHGHFVAECKFKVQRKVSRLEEGRGQDVKPVRTEKEALMTRMKIIYARQVKYDELQSELGNQSAFQVAHKIAVELESQAKELPQTTIFLK
ncbi:hypothetical protein Tco_1218708 [Tanacetum coccineum]